MYFLRLGVNCQLALCGGGSEVTLSVGELSLEALDFRPDRRKGEAVVTSGPPGPDLCLRMRPARLAKIASVEAVGSGCLSRKADTSADRRIGVPARYSFRSR